MIAVLGATGYIGGSLARILAERGAPLWLFCRNPQRIDAASWPGLVRIAPLAEFSAGTFDLVINAIGAGDPARVVALGGEILRVTQEWDERVLAGMSARTRYVFLSSGAIYGAFAEPARQDTALCLPVNALQGVSPYVIAKLYAEVRHRQLADRPILDVRVFGYADRSIPLDGKFFLSELARSVALHRSFLTAPGDMVRDYAGASELIALIDRWLEAGAPNLALDLYSREPAAKSTLLAAVAARYGIDVEVCGDVATAATGHKPIYASSYRAAAELGYEPHRTSAEIVLDALDSIRRMVG